MIGQATIGGHAQSPVHSGRVMNGLTAMSGINSNIANRRISGFTRLCGCEVEFDLWGEDEMKGRKRGYGKIFEGMLTRAISPFNGSETGARQLKQRSGVQERAQSGTANIARLDQRSLYAWLHFV